MMSACLFNQTNINKYFTITELTRSIRSQAQLYQIRFETFFIQQIWFYFDGYKLFPLHKITFIIQLMQRAEEY